MTYRILVTGSRDWSTGTILDTLHVVKNVARVEGLGPMLIVHGACPTGADALADVWAKSEPGISLERHPAIWRPNGIYNPQAGLIRNRKMVELGADICLAFIKNGSSGASHCAGLAEEAGIPTRRFTA